MTSWTRHTLTPSVNDSNVCAVCAQPVREIHRRSGVRYVHIDTEARYRARHRRDTSTT